MTLDDLWSELEENPATETSGFLRRRVLPDAKVDLYVAVTKPDNLRVLLLSVDRSITPIMDGIPSARGLEIRVEDVPDHPRQDLALVLVDRNYSDVFSALVNDLLNCVAPCKDQSSAVSVFLQRLSEWQKFLERIPQQGLGTESQLGLYGELWFLREHMLSSLDTSDSIDSWRGSEGGAQDFLYRGTAIEVKTTTGSQTLGLAISGEWQLDDSDLDFLFLVHLCVSSREGSGETLPNVVDAIRSLVVMDKVASNAFEVKLMIAGYHRMHVTNYAKTGYVNQNATVYRVQEGFPRITPTDPLMGVRDVRYSIELSACQAFLVDEGTLLNSFREASDGR